MSGRYFKVWLGLSGNGVKDDGMLNRPVRVAALERVIVKDSISRSQKDQCFSKDTGAVV